MQTILGAGGAIASELVKELSSMGHKVRLVGRNPKMVAGAVHTFPANLLDLNQTIESVSGSSIAYLLAGLKYDADIWSEQWPLIMSNTIEACKRTKTKLIFFDNVYMYGKVEGYMTEKTPFNPCSKKGEIRAQIAAMLLDEFNTGNLNAMIARSADFYGPGVRNSVPNMLVFDKFAKKKTASWLVNDTVRHSFTFVPDAARSLALLAEEDTAWNQTWHIPTAPNPPSGKEFIHMVAKEFGVDPQYRVLGSPMLKIAGWFSSDIRESYEMLYQNDSEYLFDSSRFNKAFNFKATPYSSGIQITAAAYALSVK